MMADKLPKDIDSKENPSPPTLKMCQSLLFWANVLIGLVCVLYVIGMFVLQQFSENPHELYLAMFILTINIIIFGKIRHKFVVYKKRLMDESEVLSYIKDAKSVLNSIEDKDASVQKQKGLLEEEIKHIENLDHKYWTEYKILPLLKFTAACDEDKSLIVTAMSYLNELNEYAEDEANPFDYDKRTYKEMDITIRKVIDEHLESNNEGTRETLVAETQNIQEYVCGYLKNWAEGSSLLSALSLYGTIVMLFSLFIGLIPVVHPNSISPIGIINWGFMGLSGSLGAALWDIRKTNYVEVGNTEGKKQIQRAVVGAGLGFLTGIIAYAMIGADIFIFDSPIFPDLSKEKFGFIEAFGSVFWAIVAGVSFEMLFMRVKSYGDKTYGSTERNNSD